MRARPDFAVVRLTDAGRAHAGEGETVRVATGWMHYVFIGSTPIEVVRRGEWTLLKRELDAAGQPLFEEVVATAAPAATESEEL